MSEVKDVIVQGLWKNNSALVQLLGMCPLLAVTSTATNAPRAGSGDHPGANLNQPDHLQPAPLDAGGDPDPHLRDDHRLGGERRADADQRLCLRPLSVAGDFHPAYCDQLHRGRPRRSLCRQKRAGAVGTGWLFYRHGRHLRDVCVGLPARDPWQWHPV